MNDLPCGKCALYDPILKAKEKPSRRGWCVYRSIYPAKTTPGQWFPPEAKRHSDPTKLGEPFIVRKDQVVTACPAAKESRGDNVKRKQEGQTYRDPKTGERILQA